MEETSDEVSSEASETNAVAEDTGADSDEIRPRRWLNERG